MSRDGLTSTYISSSVATIQCEYLVCMDFKPTGSEDAHVRMWTGITTQSFDDFSGIGKSYYGVGTLGNISSILEETEVAAKNLELTLSGVPSEYISLALQNNYRGRTAAVYLILYNTDRSSFQQTTMFRGRMDQLIINEGPETSTITVKCESRLIEMNRTLERRYTAEYQKSVYPLDTGLDFVAGMGNRSVYWGQSAPSSNISNSVGDDNGDGNSNEHFT